MGEQNPYCIYRRVARFFLDAEHDFILKRSAMTRVARFFLDAEHGFVLERSTMKYSRLKARKAFRWEDRIPTVCTGELQDFS